MSVLNQDIWGLILENLPNKELRIMMLFSDFAEKAADILTQRTIKHWLVSDEDSPGAMWRFWPTGKRRKLICNAVFKLGFYAYSTNESWTFSPYENKYQKICNGCTYETYSRYVDVRMGAPRRKEKYNVYKHYGDDMCPSYKFRCARGMIIIRKSIDDQFTKAGISQIMNRILKAHFNKKVVLAKRLLSSFKGWSIKKLRRIRPRKYSLSNKEYLKILLSYF